jgi:LAO/AO transport system kinase
MVDFFLLIQLAGTGDELQGIKRGIMEMADGIIVNKADGTNIDKANLAAAQYRNALQLFPLPPSGWRPKVLTYSGRFKTGVTEVWDMVFEYIDFVKTSGFFELHRHSQAKFWMYESINEQLRNHFYHSPEIEKALELKEKQVLNAEISSFIAAKQMLDLYYRNK